MTGLVGVATAYTLFWLVRALLAGRDRSGGQRSSNREDRTTP
jgi:hypothetical protein